jgi:hypothetical protein
MRRQPRFGLGQTVITPRALETLTHEEIIAALGSHVLGEWGEIDARCHHANELAIENDGPVVSTYRSRCAGMWFCVRTAGDRSVTAVFLPGEN